MRKLTTVLLLWLSVLCAISAQSVFPMADAVWEESTFTIAGQFLRYRLLCGDTTINDQQYAKLYGIIYPFDGEDLPTDTVPPANYIGSIRVDSNQVFYIGPEQSEDLLLYDFALEVETSIELPNTTLGNGGTYNVTNVDTVLVNGEERRRLFLENVFGQTDDVWIEGIGSAVYGLLDRGLGLVFDYGSSLQCMQLTDQGFVFRPDVNGSCQMAVTGCDVLSPVIDRNTYAGKIEVFPNPGRGIVHIQLPADGAAWQLELWNTKGQLLKRVDYQEENYDWRQLARGTYLLKFLRAGRPVHSEKLLLVF